MSLTQRLSSGARRPVADGAVVGPGRPRRLAKGHWVALTLGLLAFLVNIAVLRDRRETVRIAVADQEIGMATEVTEDMVRFVDMPADVAASLDLADADDIDAGVYTTDDLQEGMPLPLAETVDELPTEGQRSMSIPLGREHAAGGLITAGDRVDVIMVNDEGAAEFAATDVEVLAIGEEGDGGLGEQGGEFHVVVAVDDAQALQIAEAIRGEQIEVIRSTGAPAAQAGPTDAGPGGVVRDDTTTTPDDGDGDGDGG